MSRQDLQDTWRRFVHRPSRHADAIEADYELSEQLGVELLADLDLDADEVGP
jgi:hypothetical protein